ncbi:MAG: response regulator [Pseudomonadota bacterium]|nr:response regulator [Pseudomonadota bacterium]
MLSDCRILIAEDEALIACDLAHSVEAAHGEVAGPFATVRDGLVYLAHNDVHAAILDVHLADRDVAPLAMALLDRGRHVVFHTASEPPTEIVHRYGALAVCRKPMSPDSVVLHLARVMGRIA